MQHPNTDFVLKTINALLSEHVFKNCAVQGARYEVMSGSYLIACQNNGVTVQVKIPAERFDELEKGNDKFKRRPIKHALKNALKIELSPDD